VAARRVWGKAKLGLARLTESVRVTHAEDFDRNVSKKERNRKGRFPESFSDSGDEEEKDPAQMGSSNSRNDIESGR